MCHRCYSHCSLDPESFERQTGCFRLQLKSLDSKIPIHLIDDTGSSISWRGASRSWCPLNDDDQTACRSGTSTHAEKRYARRVGHAIIKGQTRVGIKRTEPYPDKVCAELRETFESSYFQQQEARQQIRQNCFRVRSRSTTLNRQNRFRALQVVQGR